MFLLRTHNEFVKQLMTFDFRRGKKGEMDCGQWQADPCQIYAKCPKFDQIIAEFGKVAGTWRYFIFSDHVGTSVFRKSHVFMLKKWLSFNLKPEFQLNFWEGNSPQSYTIDIKKPDPSQKKNSFPCHLARAKCSKQNKSWPEKDEFPHTAGSRDRRITM